MTTTTDRPTVERNSRGSRWFHAGIYLTVLVLLATGWWFVVGGYHRPSPLARLVGVPDTTTHELSGLVMVLVVLAWLSRGARGARTFIRETLYLRRADLGWLRHWPRAVVTGRFRHHDGHFDPGQRLANVIMLVTLVTLLLTGLGMLFVDLREPWSGWMVDLHRWATFLITPVLLGHIVIGAGVLPGYRGVWRAMHLGGRLRIEVAERLWPDDRTRPPGPPAPPDPE